MKFFSPNFQNNSVLPALYTADGEDLCPDFMIEGMPVGAKSLAIICHDPDATSGVPWVHWLAWGIPIDTKKVLGGKLPDGSVEGITSFGTTGYGGPSPSPGSGPHRYMFTLYALSSDPSLDAGQKYSLDELENILAPKVLSDSRWTGIYERS